MTGIIVTGHGNFATGLLSTVNLIAGEQEAVIGVDFIESDTAQTLEGKLKEAINSLSKDILILCDLGGGSPFNVSVLLKNNLQDKNIEVVAGTNIPMLLEVALTRCGMELEELSEFSLSSGNEGIKRFTNKKKEDKQDGCEGI